MVLAHGHAVIPPAGGVRRRAGARTGAHARDPPAPRPSTPRPSTPRPSNGFGREQLQVGAVRAAVRLDTPPGPAQPFGTPEQAAFQRPGDPACIPPGPLARVLDETRLQADTTAIRTPHRIHRTSVRTTRRLRSERPRADQRGDGIDHRERDPVRDGPISRPRAPAAFRVDAHGRPGRRLRQPGPSGRPPEGPRGPACGGGRPVPGCVSHPVSVGRTTTARQQLRRTRPPWLRRGPHRTSQPSPNA